MNRWMQHITTTRWALAQRFPRRVRDAIEAAIDKSEGQHGAELRFDVETALEFGQLWRGVTARERALQVFGSLGIWDTAANNGILVYVLLAEHDIEIVADRGFNGRVSETAWRGVCETMEAAFRRGEFEAGSVAAIDAITNLVTPHFPMTGGDRNELPNQPALL
jgi:uncharacterized membrane protein